MRPFKTMLLLILLIGSISCKKDDNKDNYEVLTNQIYFTGGMPGKHLVDMEIDNNNDFYFVTIERDTSVEVPLYASYIPSKVYLSKNTSESGDCEILDNDFLFVDEILFDKNNKLWGRHAKEIFLRDGQSIKKVIELSDEEGLFMFMAMDQQNNIWAGGLGTGLYKIDSDLNVTKMTPDNSPLPGYGMTNIHIDRNNSIWLAMWDNQGVVKITNDDWIIYNSGNSNITDQNIWCLVTDKDDNLWIGTGFDDQQNSLMRFDGQNWETINPRNDKNDIISGTVRKLFSDDQRIYVVSEQSKKMAFYSNSLLTFDGNTWNKVDQIPEDDGIADLKFDDERHAVWIRTSNKGVFKLVEK